MYNTAVADPEVVSVYERFRAGNISRAIVPEVFALDKRYNEHEWYRRVRTRLLESTDKYMAGNLVIAVTPPTIEFGPDGHPIINHKPELAPATPPSVVVVATTKKIVGAEGDPDDEDPEDSEESSFIEDILEGLL